MLHRALHLLKKRFRVNTDPDNKEGYIEISLKEAKQALIWSDAEEAIRDKKVFKTALMIIAILAITQSLIGFGQFINQKINLKLFQILKNF